jgi:NAD(P)-dependent dehydrogenase (short-subunit alcohol dehydrogenase family)
VSIHTALEHVLITGAAGMIGRAAAWHFRRLGVTTTGLVLADPGDLLDHVRW